MITVYGTPYCPMVPPVRRLLDEANVAYEYVDIRQDREAAARVREITGGNESVPTLVFPDGRTLVEPSIRALQRELQERGQGGEAATSAVVAVKAGFSNPVYLVMAVIAIALVLAVLLTS